MQDLAPVLTVNDFAKKLGISKQALWGLVKRGVITPPIKMGKRLHVWCEGTAEGIISARQSIPKKPKFIKVKPLPIEKLKESFLDQPLVTVLEVGAALGITRSSVWKLVELGIVPAPCMIDTHKYVWPLQIAVALVELVKDIKGGL
jgi:predicted DNA-binding transcriptional regulator AlpA